jgi:hypothetical protein
MLGAGRMGLTDLENVLHIGYLYELTKAEEVKLGPAVSYLAK